MRHHLFSLLSTQVPPVPTKSVHELACSILKPLHTLGLVVVGCGWSQLQHGEFLHTPAPRRGISYNPVDGRNVPTYLGSLFRCTLWNAISCRGRRIR